MLNFLGTRRFVGLGNFSCFLHFLLKACARGPAMLYSSLAPYVTGGHTFRVAPVMALHTRFALEAGMKRGEIAAARSNFEALLKIASPQVRICSCAAQFASPLVLWLPGCEG
eukprot:SAG11_NODE_8332_length_1027_cov_1.548491_1_plen_112_part_00